MGQRGARRSGGGVTGAVPFLIAARRDARPIERLPGNTMGSNIGATRADGLETLLNFRPHRRRRETPHELF